MAFHDRVALIKRIEELRQSSVICFLTSVRPNLQAHMAEDMVRVFFDQMLLLPQRPVKKLDIFLCSNGGSGTVPWRLISLFREYAESVCVLIPFRAYSAASLLALGADEIVMHPFAEMGPIDPTVANEFNPVDTQTRQRIGISVEDVKAYISFIKTTVGIHHEDELVKVIEILAQKVHPLALGNVERFISQSRLIARKILETHMKKESDHDIEEIIEMMASKLYFHGHPINRKEAREELKLKVVENVPPELETGMWKLYENFEAEMNNRNAFDPMMEIYSQAQRITAGAAPVVPVAPGVVATPPAAGAPAPAAASPAAAPGPIGPLALPAIPPGIFAEMELVVAVIESPRLSSRFVSKRRFVVAGVGQANEPMIRDETLAQGWEHSRAP